MNINPKKDAEAFVSVDEDHADSGLFLFALSYATHCIASTELYMLWWLFIMNNSTAKRQSDSRINHTL